MYQLFIKIWLKTLLPNIIIWGISFTFLDALGDKILGYPYKPFHKYLTSAIFSGFMFSFFETFLSYYLVSRLLNKYQISLNSFQFGKPYQKTKNIYTDISKIVQKIERWNKNAYQKFIIKKIEPQSLEIQRGLNQIHIEVDYGKVTIRSKHRFKNFYLEQGQNLENVELLFLIIEN